MCQKRPGVVRRTVPKVDTAKAEVSGWLVPIVTDKPASNEDTGTSGTGEKPDSGTCQNASDEVPESDVPEESVVPVADVPEGDVPELDDVADVPETAKGWRIEVTNNGRYYQWRKGSHGNRQTKKGGKFSQLDEARKESYERNKEAYHNRRAH